MTALVDRFKDILTGFEKVMSDGGADIDVIDDDLFGGTSALQVRFRVYAAEAGRAIARTEEEKEEDGFRTWLALLYKQRETLGKARVTKGQSHRLEQEVRELQLSQIKAPPGRKAAKGRQIAKAAAEVLDALEADLKGKIDTTLLNLIQQLSQSGAGERASPRRELVEGILARWRVPVPQSAEDKALDRPPKFVEDMTVPLLLHFSENATALRRFCRIPTAQRLAELDRIEAQILLERHEHMIVSPASSNRFVVLPEHWAIYRTLNHSTVRCSIRAIVSRGYIHIYGVCSISIELCKVLEAEAFDQEHRRRTTTAPRHAAEVPPSQQARKTNIEILMRECGLSYQGLAERLGLQKKTVIKNATGRSAPRPGTLKLYADEFSDRLRRKVTVAELQIKSDA